MPVSLDERLHYHPDPGDQRAARSNRRVNGRLLLLANHVDFSGKRVLDLGCSGGYFGFALADTVSGYLGIDADSALIARNRDAAARHALARLDFRQSVISPSLIRGLEAVDVVLFLSVFHHMLAASQAYEWNQRQGFDPFDVLHALRERTSILAFETGYPDEGFEWCERLPAMTPTPRAWTERKLLDAGFARVEVIPASCYHGRADRLRRSLAGVLGYARHPRPLSGQIAGRVLRVDSRDNRDLFLAYRS